MWSLFVINEIPKSIGHFCPLFCLQVSLILESWHNTSCRIVSTIVSTIKNHVLTHWGRAKHICSGKLSYRWSSWRRHNGCYSVSNHQPHGCLLNRLFRRRSKKTPKLCVTGLCAANSPGTGEFPAQMHSNAENVSIWWRNHVEIMVCRLFGAKPSPEKMVAYG